jgi:predicted RNA-binding Zn-ribbon protein involved in translation (DUF1610 family)
MPSCENMNHLRSNVAVRHCPQCGDVVNGTLPAGSCSPAEHAVRRRQQTAFCVHCGEQLIDGPDVAPFPSARLRG